MPLQMYVVQAAKALHAMHRCIALSHCASWLIHVGETLKIGQSNAMMHCMQSLLCLRTYRWNDTLRLVCKMLMQVVKLGGAAAHQT